MASFNYPFHVTKDTPAVANEVQSNFDAVLAWIVANLIQKDGTVPMTAPLVLAPGDPASPEHAANKAYVDSQIPIGVIWEYGGTTLPDGWLWCDGSTYSNTDQPLLAAKLGRTFTEAAVPAGSFQVPDKRQRASVGADATDVAFNLGKKGGQRDSELLGHSHPMPHQHTINHGHSSSLGNDTPDHGHTLTEANFVKAFGTGDAKLYSQTNNPTISGYGPYNAGGGVTGGAGSRHSHPLVVSDSVGVLSGVASTPNTTSTGAGTVLTDKNLPPYLATNFIIYAGS